MIPRLLDLLRHQWATYQARRKLRRIHWRIEEIKTWDLPPEVARSRASKLVRAKEEVSDRYTDVS